MNFYNYMFLNNYYEDKFYSYEEYIEELEYFVNHEFNKKSASSYLILGFLFEKCKCYYNSKKNYLKAYKIASIKNIKINNKKNSINKYTALTYLKNINRINIYSSNI